MCINLDGFLASPSVCLSHLENGRFISSKRGWDFWGQLNHLLFERYHKLFG